MDNPLIAQTIESVVHPSPGRGRFFLEGPPGTGKTTLAVRRLMYLLQSYVPADSILVWIPQRALGTPYHEALWELDMPGGEVTVVTVGGLARRTIALFWPLIAVRAGFAAPEAEPIFLTLETTQYYMDRVVSPYVEAGYFDGLSIRRNRLVSQIIDNLNKAAVVGFPPCGHCRAPEAGLERRKCQSADVRPGSGVRDGVPRVLPCAQLAGLFAAV